MRSSALRPPVGAGTAVRHRREPRAPALVAAGVGLGVLVALDGSLPWQVLRALAVAGLTAAALRSPRRAVVDLASGTVGLAVGVGIAVPHLTKDGPSVAAVAGLVLVAAGVVLLAGFVRHVRHRWRRGAGAVVAAVLGLFVLGQAVAATNVPPIALGSRTPADLGLDFRDVAFETTDGVALSAWYVPSRSGAAVVLLHGAGSTRSNVLPHAAVLARHGYGVLLLDARGHGRSGGRAMDFGWYGDRDVGAALSFLERQPDVDVRRGLALVGMSMGGEEAIGAGAGDPRVAAVVAEGATGRTAADKAWLSDAFGLRGAAHEVLEALMYGVTDLLTRASPPGSLRAAVAASPELPVLLIAAGDVPDEGNVAQRLRDASASVEVWTVEGSGHTGGLATEPAAWEERVTSFLADALR